MRDKYGIMSATLKDLARETGLSTAAIPKYLNGARLREKNRIAIEQAIQKPVICYNQDRQNVTGGKMLV